MNRIYIVTGAAGFLGSTICRQLVNDKQRVRALVLPNDKAAHYLPKEVEIYEGDICNKDSLKAIFKVEEESRIVVLHIASIVTVDPDYNQRVMDVNVGGTDNIIDICKSHPNFEKLVYCGSTGSIPELPMGTAISEPENYDPEKVIGCYSQSKAIAAQHVLEAAREGLNACITHPTGIMGPDDFSLSETTSTLIKIINGEMRIGIAGSFNLVDVRDLASGIIAAADCGKRGESYILGNEAVSFKEFARLVAKESGCQGVRMFLPTKFANRIATKMENKAKRSGEKPLMTTFSVYNLARNNQFDSSKARRELGYNPRSYSETIRDEVAWLQSEGHIKDRDTMEETKKKRSLKKGIVKTYIGIENAVVGSYKAIENGVVGGYKAIENGAVKGYKAVEDATVGAYKEIESSAKNMGKSLVEEYNKQKSEKKK
jgi:dihydroflavonol-4-reductase